MAADLLLLGLEIVTAVTAALLVVFLLRAPVRAAFGARAAYCLWLLVPAMALAVFLPRAAPDTGADDPASVAAAAAAGQVPAARGLPVADASDAFRIERLEILPNPVEFASPLLLLWAVGTLIFAAFLIYGQRRFLRTLGPLRAEQRPDGRVFHALGQDVGPALVGALSPRVVLPADFAERFSPEEQVVVLAHERVHQSGGDAQINLMVAAARAVLWFHPIVHIAAHLIRVDQELACDETVIARFPAARRLYAGAMLKTQLVGAPVPLGCHWLTDGKRELRNRITRLTRMPGRTRRLAGTVLAAALALAGGAVAWAAQPPAAVPGLQSSGRHGRALIEAIQDGDTGRAAELIRSGADVDFRWPGDGSPLILAARAGDIPLVRLLIERGANVNLTVHGDGSPLIAASAGGWSEIVALLLAEGAEIDTIVPSDETALINAAREGHLDVVRQLVERGADVNLAVMAERTRPLPPQRRSPLGMAEAGRHLAVADYLRAHGARA